MASGKLFLVAGVGVAAVAAVLIMLAMTPTATSKNVEQSTKTLASTVEDQQDNTTDTRTLAQGQDENARTQVVNVEQAPTKQDKTEKFIVTTFDMQPNEIKKIIFKTAKADSVLLTGTVSVKGVGYADVKVETPKDKICFDCGPYHFYGDEYPAFHGTDKNLPWIVLRPDLEQTLVIQNKADAGQKVSLDLSISYTGLVVQ